MDHSKMPHNFGGLPRKFSRYDNAAIVILPVPFDETSTWGKGADKGPEAIIEASKHMELFDIETNSEVYKKAIHTASPIKKKTSARMVDAVYRKTKKLIEEGKFVVTVGGEHSVSIGTIKAHGESFRNFSILHLDAHSDRRERYEGSKYNHACVMARVAEFCPRIVSVGIRSMDVSETKRVSKKNLFLAHEIVKSRGWIDAAGRNLSSHVYVTIDLDVFDPSIVPSTGTPEPGGLDWYQVTSLLRAVSKKKCIVGFDVVELCPSHDTAPDFLAAKLIYKLLSYIFCKG
jgi:agmatinase